MEDNPESSLKSLGENEISSYFLTIDSESFCEAPMELNYLLWLRHYETIYYNRLVT